MVEAQEGALTLQKLAGIAAWMLIVIVGLMLPVLTVWFVPSLILAGFLGGSKSEAVFFVVWLGGATLFVWTVCRAGSAVVRGLYGGAKRV